MYTIFLFYKWRETCTLITITINLHNFMIQTKRSKSNIFLKFYSDRKS